MHFGRMDYSPPSVLLSFWTSLKDVIDLSPAKLVYDELLVFPAKFFQSSQQDVYPKQLQRSVDPFTPARRISKGTALPHIPDALLNCRFVFLHIDSNQAPLTHPYSGPHLVIERSSKVYRINMQG